MCFVIDVSLFIFWYTCLTIQNYVTCAHRSLVPTEASPAAIAALAHKGSLLRCCRRAWEWQD